MDDTAAPPPSSQASSSHSPFGPLPASLLLDQELARKERLRRRGNLTTGCRELDEYVLLGGFERGSVVGVSAEEEEMGLAEPAAGAATKEATEGEKRHTTEVLDSEGEDGLSSPEPTPNTDPALPPNKPHHDGRPDTAEPTPSSAALPDLILITHTSTLLSALFTGRDKDVAHNTMLQLSSHLRSLTRSSSHSTPPLILFLNSTNAPSSSQYHSSDSPSAPAEAAAPVGQTRPPKQQDPTLRSIFNPPPPPPAQGYHGFAAAARRSKPAFGLVFAQMLDLHLLCTRVPRTRADVAALVASPGAWAARESVTSVWVVEVLLDEIGVYGKGADGGCDWGEWRSREQRWGVVDADAEGRVVDAVIP
ncbi:53f8500f-8201-4620-a17f-1d8ec48babf6 [Thermothielavioides terrestris]|uniref:53f8500f-8201-4620-a17f-1d8ec48babf6 n=1 Tax=Thermothielavioides terrestris TaxID=2587410 RepID=A0A3S4EYL1_9PEZI|nr:53f8500f-8201-4620-a17f-1d8ec48babf6 [Thermothielavioides terrestris]